MSAQIEGYYRINNVSGVDGQSYLNVNTHVINPCRSLQGEAADGQKYHQHLGCAIDTEGSFHVLRC